jgi:acyl phosphate:glycerol-3-phosphate acyltransferase
MTLELALLFVGAYLLGSIPFGVLIARSKGIDIRKVGSGNIGATNVIRALGTGPGVLVFVLDVLKGLIPAVAARWIAPDRQDVWFSAGAAAVVGHTLSPFLGFKGGKGIATALGMMLGAATLTALASFVVFTVFLIFPRYMSLASLVAVVSANLFGYLFHDSPGTRIGFLLLSLFIFYKHKANMVRLANGTEPKFSFRRTVPPPDDSPGDQEPPRDGEVRGSPSADGVAQ